MNTGIFGRKRANSLADRKYKTILDAAPDYVGTLLSGGFLTLDVYAPVEGVEPPSVAWTYWGESDRSWHVSFREEVATLNPDAIRALWRHEIGHIGLAHFVQETCNPDDPIRSRMEQIQVGDIHINTYLLDRPELLEEIGELVLSLADEETRARIESEGGKGFVDPRVALPDIGLEVQ